MRKRIQKKKVTSIPTRAERMKNFMSWRVKNLMTPLSQEEYILIRAKI